MTNTMKAPCTLWGKTFDADSIVEIQTLDDFIRIHIFRPNNRLWYAIDSPCVQYRGQRDELLKELITTIGEALNKARKDTKALKEQIVWDLENINVCVGNYPLEKMKSFFNENYKKKYPNLSIELFPENGKTPKELMTYIDTLFKENVGSDRQKIILTHSIFVLKKVHNLALKNKTSVPILIYDEEIGAWRQENLKKGMPINPLVEVSLKLFEEEMKL